MNPIHDRRYVRIGRVAAVYLVLLGTAAASFGQVPGTAVVPRPEEIRRGTEIEPRRTPDSASPQGSPSTPPREIQDAPGLSIDVKGYRIVGTSRVGTDEIAQLLARYTGPGKSFQDLRDAVEEVKARLAAQGLPLAHVYLPEQEIRDGIVEIAVIEGRLGQVLVEVAPGSPVGESVIRRYTAQLASGQVITVREIERVLFLLRDLYGIAVRAEFRSGSAPGTADLVVQVTPDRRLEGLVEFDNAGARFTGEYRATIGARLASPLGQGDSLSARHIQSLDGGQGISLLSYGVPVGTQGTKLGVSYIYVHFEIDPDAVGIDIRGHGHVTTVFGLHPVVRSRNLNLFALASFDFKRYEENTGGFRTERHIDLLTLGLTGDSADTLFGGGLNSFSAAFGGGRLERPFNSLSVPPTLDRNFKRLQLGYTRLQQLPLPRTLLLTKYSGQLTNNNLDPYEQFVLGGASVVRAYGFGEAAGDEGHQITAELRWSPDKRELQVPGNIAFQLFYDWGTVRLFSDSGQAQLSAGQSNRRTIAGPGVGATWDVPGSFQGRVSVAWPTVGTNVNDPRRRSPRAFFSLSKIL